MATASSLVDDPFFEEVVSALPEGVIAVNEAGTVVFAAAAVERLLGYTPEELLEQSITQLRPEPKAFSLERLLDEFGPDTDGTGAVDSFVDSRGEEVPVRLVVTEAEYDGQWFGILSFRERSDERQRERTERRVESPLEDLFDNASDGVFVLDPETGEILECNARFFEMLEYSREEVLALDPSELFAEDVDRFRSYVEQVSTEGVNWIDDVPCRTRSGRCVPVALFAVRIETDEGNRVVANVRDISERKRYKQRLKALNEASRRLMIAETETEVATITVDVVETVFDRSLTAVWTVDDETGVLHPLATSAETADRSQDDADTLPPVVPGTAEMDVFHTGNTRLFAEYDTVDARAHPDMGLKTRLVASLGAYGLLAVGSTAGDDIGPALCELVDILARATQAAFERLSREQAVRHRSAAIGAAPDGIAITDQAGEFTYVNDALATLSGYGDSSEVVGHAWTRLYEDDEVDRLESDVLPAVEERGKWQGEAMGKRTGETTFPQEISLSTLDDGGLVWVVRDVTAQKERERQLQSLNDVVHKLIEADSHEAIATSGLDAIVEAFEHEVACVRLLDRETGRLELAALTDGAKHLLESYTAYDLEATLAGQAFRTGETLETISAGSSKETRMFEYPSYHVPLGGHGVLSVIVKDDDTVDSREIQLAEVVAANLRTAIERSERTQLIEEHEHELRQQRDQLETLDRIHTLIQVVEKRLVEATTRAELEQTICEHLAGSSLYTGAWIGDTEFDDHSVSVRAGAGIADATLNAIGEMPLHSVEDGTVERAIETRTVRVVRQYRLLRSDTDECDEEVSATAAVPLVHGDRVYGVLVVHGANEDVFSEKAVLGFESLGKMTGFAINAIKNRDILLSDSIVELELEVADPRVFYVQVTDELECTCRFDRSVHLDEGRIMHYHTIRGAEPDAVVELSKQFSHIEQATVMAEQADRFVLQTITGESSVQTALRAGANIRSATAEAGSARLVIEAPQSADIRKIVEQFERAFSTLTLVSKRERERPVQTAGEFRETVATQLTEKQRAAIESAYFSGYYDWPRKITAEDLAESMDISSSTLHQHLRQGIRSLLNGFFEEAEGGNTRTS